MMHNNELIYLLVSFIAGINIGLIRRSAALRKSEKGRIWAENEMIKAHKRILELEKELSHND
jgi:hypothetical protein